MRDQDHVELSAEFRRALDSAPRVAAPSRRLEGRMVRALRRRGLVLPDRWAVMQHPVWGSALRVAASLVIFAGGVSLGHALGSPQSSTMPIGDDVSAWELGAQVQQTGSTHAEALQRLASRAAAAQPEEIELATEVAMSTIRAALHQLVLLDPSNPTPARLLNEIRASEAGSWLPVRVSDGPWVISF